MAATLVHKQLISLIHKNEFSGKTIRWADMMSSTLGNDFLPVEVAGARGRYKTKLYKYFRAGADGTIVRNACTYTAPDGMISDMESQSEASPSSDSSFVAFITDLFVNLFNEVAAEINASAVKDGSARDAVLLKNIVQSNFGASILGPNPSVANGIHMLFGEHLMISGNPLLFAYAKEDSHWKALGVTLVNSENEQNSIFQDNKTPPQVTVSETEGDGGIITDLTEIIGAKTFSSSQLRFLLDLQSRDVLSDQDRLQLQEIETGFHDPSICLLEIENNESRVECFPILCHDDVSKLPVISDGQFIRKLIAEDMVKITVLWTASLTGKKVWPRCAQ